MPRCALHQAAASPHHKGSAKEPDLCAADTYPVAFGLLQPALQTTNKLDALLERRGDQQKPLAVHASPIRKTFVKNETVKGVAFYTMLESPDSLKRNTVTP